MANPSGTSHEPTQASSSFNGHTNGNPVPAPDNSMDWTAEEQSILEEGLAKYASKSNIMLYAKIAVQLQNKTVRDVALRCRWMTKKENSKRRKEDHSLTRKGKDRKEKMIDLSAKSSHLAARPGFPPFAQGMETNVNDDGFLYNAIGGATGQLLRQNARALEQISANFEVHQIHENIGLLCQARENLLKILNNLSDVPDTMKQMPPLPVKVNEELANSILPPTTFSMQS